MRNVIRISLIIYYNGIGVLPANTQEISIPPNKHNVRITFGFWKITGVQ